MKKIERCIKRLGKIRFPKGIDLEPLKRQARVNGNKGMSISDEFVADWFVVPSKGLAIYKTYDNLSLTNPIAKQIKNIRMYNELLCAKLCDTVGIKHAVYERAHYADTNGLISYSILDDQERLSSIISNTKRR